MVTKKRDRCKRKKYRCHRDSCKCKLEHLDQEVKLVKRKVDHVIVFLKKKRNCHHRHGKGGNDRAFARPFFPKDVFCHPFGFRCDDVLTKQKCCFPVQFPSVCDDRIRLRLAGLTGNLNFKLFRLKGCPVMIETDCPGPGNVVEGILCNVGTNFVDVRRDDDTVVTVLNEQIQRIEWPDPACKPCVRKDDLWD